MTTRTAQPPNRTPPARLRAWGAARSWRAWLSIGCLCALLAGVGAWIASPGGSLSSPLNSPRGLTCRGGGASCVRRGAVRWSLPIPGRYYNLHALTPERVAPVSFDERSQDFDHADAAYAGGLVIYQDGGLVEAIDADTGVMRWRTELSPSSRLVATPWLEYAPLVSGRIVAVVACTGPPDRTRIWTLDLATGRPSGPGAELKSSCQDDPSLLAAWGTGVTVADSAGLTSLDPGTGRTRWVLSTPLVKLLNPPITSAVIGDVMYFAQPEHGHAALERVDVRDGRMLPPLTLDPRLPAAGIISGRAQQLGELLYTGVNTIARIDPRTGRAVWIVHGRTDDTGGSADVIRVDPASDQARYFTQSHSGLQLRVLDLTTGRQVLNVPGDRIAQLGGLTNDDALSDGLLVMSSAQTGIPARPQHPGLDRLEALDPRTLRPVWLGPWSSDSLEILPGPVGAPHLAIALSCAPDGIKRRGTICTKMRLYAVNT